MARCGFEPARATLCSECIIKFGKFTTLQISVSVGSVRHFYILIIFNSDTAIGSLRRPGHLACDGVVNLKFILNQ